MEALDQLIQVRILSEEYEAGYIDAAWSIDGSDAAGRDWSDVVAVAADEVLRKVRKDCLMREHKLSFSRGPDADADVAGLRHVRVAIELLECLDGADEDRAPDMAVACEWARSASAGDYLVEYEDTGMTAAEDPGSRCGYDDQQLDEIGRLLRERDLRLTADDCGLVAQARDPE